MQRGQLELFNITVPDVVTCNAGNVSMTCAADTQGPPALPLSVFLAPSIIGFLLLLTVIFVFGFYWRRLATDVATYKQSWHKRRLVLLLLLLLWVGFCLLLLICISTEASLGC